MGDLDILVTCEDTAAAMDRFTSCPGVSRVIAKGPTKSSVVIGSGVQVDLRVVEAGSFGAALVYFTGSKAHNVALRSMALKRGLKLNEYGVFRGDDYVRGRDRRGRLRRARPAVDTSRAEREQGRDKPRP